MLFKNQNEIINNGKTSELKEARRDILHILAAAVNSVDAYNVVKKWFDGNNISFDSKRFQISDYKNVFLIGFGKASIGMANAVCDSISVKKGAIITNEPNKKVKKDYVSTFVGSHPIPNQKNIYATEKLLDIVSNCKENDLLIVLISGGGSSLFCKPRVSINDLRKTTNLLLRSGANIKEINTIRKHLSFVKGGQLAKYAKCRVITFIISDIIGDPIQFISSGPTYPDSTTFIEAQNILKRYKLYKKIPLSVRNIISDGIKGIIPETPNKSDKVFNKVYNLIVANNKIACNAAKKKAEKLGYKTMLLTTILDGEAKEMGRYLIRMAKNYKSSKKKMIFISGGETTVTVKGVWIGGRKLYMVLGIVIFIDFTLL